MAAPDIAALLLADHRSPATKRAYAADLKSFFNCAPGPAVVQEFCAQPVPAIALQIAQYKSALLGQGLSEATVNRRLAAIRSLLKFAHRLGYSATDGSGLVDGEKSKSYRDTRGITLQLLRRLLQQPQKKYGGLSKSSTERDNNKSPMYVGILRDTAILLSLCENALRRAELCSLNATDFNPASRQLLILGKGRGTQKQAVTLSPACVAAIAAYLEAAGHSEGALFRNLNINTPAAGKRLTADGLYYLIQEYGAMIGVPKLTPHKLRHSSITAALDATGGDVRKVQRLSRHADLRTLSIYDDNRTDMAGEVTNLLSGLLHKGS